VSSFDPFALDDPTASRQRYTKDQVKRGETERVQCRADAFKVRRIDEIVAARIEPELGTRSDVLNDAIDLWLEDWDRRYPDGASGQLRYQSELLNMERKRQYRQGFIDQAETQLTGLREEGDLLGLKSYVGLMLRARGDFMDDAPDSFMERMDKLISEARRLLDAH
jgi:hypothetical protein